MRIRISPIPTTSTQGATKFRKLLATELSLLGHELTDWSSDASFDTVLTRGPLPSHWKKAAKAQGAKVIVQFGGWDWSPGSTRLLGDSMRSADGIIYNSKFGLEQVHSAGIHPSCPEVVIPNGTDRGPPASLNSPIFLVACEQYGFPAKAKALKATIDAISIVRKILPSSKLHVLGDAPTWSGIDERLGLIRDPVILQEIRSRACMLIHLVEGDQCPNTVLESLAQGIPVLYHARSGTPEIVRWYGQSVDIMDIQGIVDACLNYPKWKPLQDKWLKEFDSMLSITSIAKQYEGFLVGIQRNKS
jgi:glycosyltransferase involved in cell wall biosynthesis